MKTKATASSLSVVDPLEDLAKLPGGDYAVDAIERSVLFLDTMRRRGNTYVEHLNAGEPPLLKFEHELVLDGRDLPRPCNYALLHMLPPVDTPIDPRARPVVVLSLIHI